ncbi:MAG: HAD-IIA family hydrolase [Planctomycetes bacterium]|nr:HAD-IIA family hydrolase [Planctomycetota bacterium]
MPLARLRGFALDLDGTVWAGERLLPGAADCVGALRAAGLPVVFLTNNSRDRAAALARRLTRLGIAARSRDVIAAVDLLGAAIRQRLGPARVLPLGARGLRAALAAADHTPVAPERWAEAQAVALGNDPTFDYRKLRAASRAVRAGALFFATNLDARMPTGPEGDFDPGCGALAEAIAVAGGVRPIVVGKPHGPMFEDALARLRCGAAKAAIVGDNPGTDIAGGRAAGLFTVRVAAGGAYEPDAAHEADLVVRDLRELLARWRDARGAGTS